jgi:hypothetical protein
LREEGPENGQRLDAGVPVEIPVLHGEDGLDDRGGEILEPTQMRSWLWMG